MIVSKFENNRHARELGSQIAQLLELKQDDEGRYATAWGTKTSEGLARCIERMYRESVYGREEQIPDDDRYYAANIAGEDPVWPAPKEVDKTGN
jgi:hypothetical protein